MEHRIRFLDGWRGCAIIAVLFGHFVTAAGLNAGRFGVELFFVLSGRLMAEILFVKRTPLAAFFPRRFARIYPTLFVFVLVLYLVGHVIGRFRFGWPHLAGALTLTWNYVQLWEGRHAVLEHLWSLCVEEHLYILLGGIAALHRVRPMPVPLVLAGLGALFCLNGLRLTLHGLPYEAVYWRSDVRGASILFGAAAYLWLDGRKAPPLTPLVLGVAGLLLSLNLVPDPVKYSLGSALLAASVALLPSGSERLKAGLQSPVLLGAGTVSYSLYLWQQPFYAASSSPLARLALLPLAVAAGAASYRWLETPARRFLNGVLARGGVSRQVAPVG